MQYVAHHGSPPIFDGARSTEALRQSSLLGSDPQSKFLETSRFLKEVRIRLFAETPPEGKRGELSPLRTSVSVSSHAPYVSPSMAGNSRGTFRATYSPRGPEVSSPVMEMSSGSETQDQPSACTAADIHDTALHSLSSRAPSLAASKANSKGCEKENVPARHVNNPKVTRPSMGRKLDFNLVNTSEAATVDTPSMSACDASPLFSPMQIDTAPRAAMSHAPVPPVPSFLKRRAQASAGANTAEQPQKHPSNQTCSGLPADSSPSLLKRRTIPSMDFSIVGEQQNSTGTALGSGIPGGQMQSAVGTEPGKNVSSEMLKGRSPKVPSSSVTALQHLAGWAAQEAAASQGADEEMATQVKYCVCYHLQSIMAEAMMRIDHF